MYFLLLAADRAKQIKTKATVNESPTDKLIRELKEENDKLKKMLEGKTSRKMWVFQFYRQFGLRP